LGSAVLGSVGVPTASAAGLAAAGLGMRLGGAVNRAGANDASNSLASEPPSKNPVVSREAGIARRDFLKVLAGTSIGGLIAWVFWKRASQSSTVSEPGQPIALNEEYGRGKDWFGRWVKLTGKQIKDIHRHSFL